jgi:serine/threonine protein kinase
VGLGEDWKVATVIDEDTMQRCTLKMLTKNDAICKSQIVNEIKNQKKMAGRPNFIELKAVYEDANLIYLLMELWGIPLEKILTRRRALMEREVQLIFCQLVDIL